MKSKRSIQASLIQFLDKNGTIDLLLPDGVSLNIGITEETKHGLKKNPNYCWVEVKQNERSTQMDKYSLSINYDKDKNFVINEKEDGTVAIF